jgi:hypothetical protein
MSLLSAYIKTLPFSAFPDVKDHFLAKHCRVLEFGNSYMIVAPNVVHESESADFRAAMLHAVGTILAKGSNVIQCFGFPKTKEIAPGELSIDGPVFATEYLAGTLVRAFFDGYYWRLSTNGAIDAYDNYWISSRSIGNLFDECLVKIYNMNASFAYSPLAGKLNKDYTYQFVLQHPEVHLEMIERPYIYHIATFDNKALRYVELANADRLPRPLSGTFDNMTEFLEHYNKTKCDGFTLCAAGDADSQTRRFKIIKPDHAHKIKLLGRTSNLYLRYLECKAEGLDRDLVRNFPGMRYYATAVERFLHEIAHETNALYAAKYIGRNYNLEINYYLRPIINALHIDYQRTRVRVSPGAVLTLLASYHPKRINFLLNGLGYIRTGDVTLEHEKQQPEVVPTQDEIDEIADVIENKDTTGGAYGLDYVVAASDEKLEETLRKKCFETIVSEITIDYELGIRYPEDICELIFAEFLAMSPTGMAYCLEDHSYITERITEFKENVMGMLELDGEW